MGKTALKRLGMIVVAGCALALAACGGGSPSTCGAPGAPPTIPALTMVDPSPGATAVPLSLNALVFSGTPESNTKIVLTANGATVATISTLTQPQSGEYEAALPSALSAATTYSVIYEYTIAPPAGSACGSQGYTQSLGSFTTQ